MLLLLFIAGGSVLLIRLEVGDGLTDLLELTGGILVLLLGDVDRDDSSSVRAPHDAEWNEKQRGEGSVRDDENRIEKGITVAEP